ncbi:MAG TPA: GDYXXLXY domain-containing protein [Allosphingosinicella sp.]|jgi:uncharacterized membrane-anchored protein
MGKLLAIASGLVLLAVVNFGIWQREQLLRDGDIVLLRLAPIDPRSLVQGDYMRLNFEIARDAAIFEPAVKNPDGRIVVALDARGVASFRRFDDRRPLAPGEAYLRYRFRGGPPNFGTNAYFFQEGRSAVYAAAMFGEFRVGKEGDMILTGLRDERLRKLGAD